MSRHTQTNSNIHIAYGFDDMMPGAGYFFQVFDDNKITDENDDGIVLNEGFVEGIGKEKMFNLMKEYNIKNEEHLKLVAMDLPI
jgi:hypothetical protein